ncbi:MAG TPA: TerB family tellurite resistance protein [Nevskiaceae bacterium]|nr:TerB family tellurite resistance protein [Nevskiaceae bacterium]
MLRRWLERIERAEGPAKPPPRHLAVAVLLVECARADFDRSPLEVGAVRDALAGHFGLSADDVDALVRDAGTEAERSVSLHGYVARLNGELDPDAKRGIVGLLWRVAWADGRIDPHEEALIRRLADLLYVPHAQFVQEKLASSPPT